jgi:hypothetical protein
MKNFIRKLRIKLALNKSKSKTDKTLTARVYADKAKTDTKWFDPELSDNQDYNSCNIEFSVLPSDLTVKNVNLVVKNKEGNIFTKIINTPHKLKQDAVTHKCNWNGKNSNGKVATSIGNPYSIEIEAKLKDNKIIKLKSIDTNIVEEILLGKTITVEVKLKKDIEKWYKVYAPSSEIKSVLEIFIDNSSKNIELFQHSMQKKIKNPYTTKHGEHGSYYFKVNHIKNKKTIILPKYTQSDYVAKEHMPWPTYYWSTLSENVNLYEEGGPLEKYDIEFPPLNGEKSSQYIDNKAYSNLEQPSWSGFCDKAIPLSICSIQPKLNNEYSPNINFTEDDLEGLLIRTLSPGVFHYWNPFIYPKDGKIEKGHIATTGYEKVDKFCVNFHKTLNHFNFFEKEFTYFHPLMIDIGKLSSTNNDSREFPVWNHSVSGFECNFVEFINDEIIKSGKHIYNVEVVIDCIDDQIFPSQILSIFKKHYKYRLEFLYSGILPKKSDYYNWIESEGYIPAILRIIEKISLRYVNPPNCDERGGIKVSNIKKIIDFKWRFKK